MSETYSQNPRKYSKTNFVDLVELITPNIYTDEDLSLSGTQLNPISNIINSNIRASDNISTVLSISAVSNSQTSAINTLAGFSQYFVKQNDLTNISPYLLETKLLLPLGSTLANFSTSGEFSTYLSENLLPMLIPATGSNVGSISENMGSLSALSLNADASSVHNYLVDALGWFYFLNTSADGGLSYDPSSYVLSSLLNVYRGQTLETVDGVKGFTNYIWNNYETCTAFKTYALLPGEFVSGTLDTILTPSDGTIATYTSGTQRLDKLETWLDVIYSPAQMDKQDFKVKTAFQDYIDSSLYLDDRVSQGPFRKFTNALGFSFADISDQIENIGLIYDIENAEADQLQYIAELIGWKLQGASSSKWRQQLRTAVDVYKKTGTLDVIQYAINHLIIDSVLDVSGNTQELWESYLPFMIWYSLGTESEYFRSLKTWTPSIASQAEIHSYNTSSLQENLMIVTDSIVLDLYKMYPEYFLYGGERMPVPRMMNVDNKGCQTSVYTIVNEPTMKAFHVHKKEDSNFEELAYNATRWNEATAWEAAYCFGPLGEGVYMADAVHPTTGRPQYLTFAGDLEFVFNYRGKTNCPLPPFEEHKYYKDSTIGADLVETLVERLKCFGVTPSFADSAGDYILSAAVTTETALGSLNEWLMFFPTHQLAPNYNEVLRKISLYDSNLLDLWNGKSSHLFIDFSSTDFDFSKTTMEGDGRYALYEAARIANEFTPAHVINRVNLSVSDSDPMDYSGTRWEYLGFKKEDNTGLYGGPSALLGNYETVGVDMRSIEGYELLDHKGIWQFSGGSSEINSGWFMGDHASLSAFQENGPGYVDSDPWSYPGMNMASVLSGAGDGQNGGDWFAYKYGISALQENTLLRHNPANPRMRYSVFLKQNPDETVSNQQTLVWLRQLPMKIQVDTQQAALKIDWTTSTVAEFDSNDVRFDAGWSYSWHLMHDGWIHVSVEFPITWGGISAASSTPEAANTAFYNIPYDNVIIEIQPAYSDTQAGSVFAYRNSLSLIGDFKRGDVDSINKRMVGQNGPMSYYPTRLTSDQVPRRAIRRRNMRYTLPTAAFYDRTGFNGPNAFDPSSIEYSMPSSLGELTLGYVPSAGEFYPVVDPVNPSSVWHPCETLESQHSFSGQSTSATFPYRGLSSLGSNAKSGPSGTARYVDRGELPGIYNVMHKYFEQKAKAYALSQMKNGNNVTMEQATQTNTMAPEYVKDEYKANMPWKKVLQSFANEAIASGLVIESFEDYRNFSFGSPLHKLYKDYTNYFQKHPIGKNSILETGPNIFAQVLGKGLYNCDFSIAGSASITEEGNYIASSFTTSIPISNNNGQGVFSVRAVSAYGNNVASGSYIASGPQDMIVPLTGTYISPFNEVSSTYGFAADYNAEFRNPNILSGIEFVDISGSPTGNEFRLFNIDSSLSKKVGDNPLVNNTVVQCKTAGGLPRLRFDLSSYGPRRNYFIKDHEFELVLSSFIGDEANPRVLGGGSIGAWIHTNAISIHNPNLCNYSNNPNDDPTINRQTGEGGTSWTKWGSMESMSGMDKVQTGTLNPFGGRRCTVLSAGDTADSYTAIWAVGQNDSITSEITRMPTFKADSTITMSCYVKEPTQTTAASAIIMNMYDADTADSHSTYWKWVDGDLQMNSLGFGIGQETENVGNGWWRISVWKDGLFSGGSEENSFRPIWYIRQGTPSLGGESVAGRTGLFYGFQVEQAKTGTRFRGKSSPYSEVISADPIPSNDSLGYMWSWTPQNKWELHRESDISIGNVKNKWAHIRNFEEKELPPYDQNTCLLDVSAVPEESTYLGTFPRINKSHFEEVKFKFNTKNFPQYNNFEYLNMPDIPDSYYKVEELVNRDETNYIVEVFFLPPVNPRKYLLLDQIGIQDSTLREEASIGTGYGQQTNGIPFRKFSKEDKYYLDAEDLRETLKFFNGLIGQGVGEYATNLASRTAAITSGVMEFSGGSRVNYRYNPDWGTYVKNRDFNNYTEIDLIS